MTPISALRTPDSRFNDLPGYPFTPHYLESLPGFEGLRMHYLDVGPADATTTMLCLHGEPTWSYLYRKMIPVFVAAGCRVIAPDLFGFGRSDKPVKPADYSYHFHRQSVIELVQALDLSGLCLVCQDWGGILGLSVPMEMPERFTRLLVMNTALPTGEAPSPGFVAWRDYMQQTPDLDVGRLMLRSTSVLTPAEAAAYDAPFPDRHYKEGVRRFPEMVMTQPGMDGIEESRRALAFWSRDWTGQSFMAIGQADPVLGEPVMRALSSHIQACPEPMLVPEAGHFVQEWGEEIAHAACAHFGLTPTAQAGGAG